jgi:hypothetical protein
MGYTAEGYNAVWPSYDKVAAPWVIIMSGFAGLILLFILSQAWFSLLSLCFFNGKYRKIKVDTVDYTFVPNESEEERNKRRSSMSTFTNEYDADEDQLQKHIEQGAADAHDRLMERLRRSSVRVATKTDESKPVNVHPLTRRKSSAVNNADDDDDDTVVLSDGDDDEFEV